jgi:hypothetical protein
VTPTAPPTTDRLTPAARLAVAVLAAALVMHGCHGPDDDHEPGVVPPLPVDRRVD